MFYCATRCGLVRLRQTARQEHDLDRLRRLKQPCKQRAAIAKGRHLLLARLAVGMPVVEVSLARLVVGPSPNIRSHFGSCWLKPAIEDMCPAVDLARHATTGIACEC